MSDEAKRDRVDQIITLLQLRKCQDRIIGSVMQKGISGGERRRVSLGCQMITNPALLFLDEPTSGLDTYTAFNVIQILKHVAQTQQRTVGIAPLSYHIISLGSHRVSCDV
jgi:ABC-type multidrug transport system ATPase subunit